jgi:ketosteroid isomerase-like protein
MPDAVRTVRAFYSALAEGDVPGVVALLHHRLEWTEAEGFPYYSGTWRHPDEIVEKLLVPLRRDWHDFAATVHDVISDGDRVVTFGVYSGVNKATRKTLRAAFVHVWRVMDGKISRFDMWTDTLLIHRATES